MGLTHKTLYGRLMKGIDMKKISSVVSLSLLVLFLLVGCEKSSTQSSSDWVKYKTDENGTFYYKKGNIDKNGGNYIVQVLVKEVFSDKDRVDTIQRMIKIGMSTKGTDKLSEKELLTEQDCIKHRIRFLSQTLYDSDGKVLLSQKDHNPGWKYIISNSPEEVSHKIFCK